MVSFSSHNTTSPSSLEIRKGMGETQIYQPTPTRPKRSFASYLEGVVDPFLAPPESSSVFVTDWLEGIGPERKRICRSDGYLQLAPCDATAKNLRDLTRSVSAISGFQFPHDLYCITLVGN